LYYQPNSKTAAFIKKLEFPEEWHYLLNEYTTKKGGIFFSSPTYLKAVDLLSEIDVPLFKLASAQVGTFPQLVEKVAALNKPTIFSTGISGYSDVIEAVRIFKKHGNNQYIILHCNSIYPTPPDRVNMPLMDTYRAMFDCPVGFSDHTNGIHISLAAVVSGANVIEKHFTLDRNLGTPDCSTFASDPNEMTELVRQVREIENALIQSADRINIQPEENAFKEEITYRVFTSRGIEEGETIQLESVQYLRHPEGINCKHEHLYMGKITNTHIPKNQLIQPSNFI
jgi:sialic acid synthase SpsE